MRLVDCNKCRHASNMGAMVGCDKYRKMIFNPHIECEDFKPRMTNSELLRMIDDLARGGQNARD